MVDELYQPVWSFLVAWPESWVLKGECDEVR